MTNNAQLQDTIKVPCTLQKNAPLEYDRFKLLPQQAKAGKAEEALATFAAMQQRGIKPVTRTMNNLLSAFARVGQPFRAKDIMDDLVKRYGVKPDRVTWNTLLSAFARAQHVDGAYEAWQQMQQSGVAPDNLTQVAEPELPFPQLSDVSICMGSFTPAHCRCGESREHLAFKWCCLGCSAYCLRHSLAMCLWRRNLSRRLDHCNRAWYASCFPHGMSKPLYLMQLL